jgi:two-component system, chemotaxis family, protein-glutamate methylesterase/glutaminase
LSLIGDAQGHAFNGKRTNMIKVLLADDSLLTRTVVREILRNAGDIEVVGEAADGREAVELTALLKPDLVVIDILMPVMDGLAAIEMIMAQTPTPILVLSATVDEREISRAFVAIKKGALDVMEKPLLTAAELQSDFTARLVEKVRLLSRIRVIRRWAREKPAVSPSQLPQDGKRSVLAIGASTGGPKAVMSIIRALPADFPAAVFIVQHIANGFAKGFAQWLGSESRIRVRLAEEGDGFSPGAALVAPNDCHMTVERGKVRLVGDPPVNCCRPSIDVFFNALAAEKGQQTVGVLLTGMGKDGAQGLLRIRENGGVTLAQNEETSAVFGMPKAAIGLNAADKVLSLDRIPETIAGLFSSG